MRCTLDARVSAAALNAEATFVVIVRKELGGKADAKGVDSIGEYKVNGGVVIVVISYLIRCISVQCG